MDNARHHIIIYPFFKWLTRYLVARDFHEVKFDVDFNDNGNAVLVIANHTSWWDGFWVEYLNQKILKRKLHFMMENEQLERFWYFNHAGGYPVKKGTRQVAATIAYTVELLNFRGNMVLIFPQGGISSSYNDRFVFQGGVDKVLKRGGDDVQVLMVANLTDYFSNREPSLFINAEGFVYGQLKNESLEYRYNEFYHKVLSRHKNRGA